MSYAEKIMIMMFIIIFLNGISIICIINLKGDDTFVDDLYDTLKRTQTKNWWKFK